MFDSDTDFKYYILCIIERIFLFGDFSGFVLVFFFYKIIILVQNSSISTSLYSSLNLLNLDIQDVEVNFIS